MSGLGGMMGLQDHFFSLVDSLSAVRKLSQITIDGVDEQTLLRQALEALMENQDMGFCSIFLLRDGELRCAVGTGLGDSLASRFPGQKVDCDSMVFALGEGVIGQACQSGQIQYCRNCGQDERFKPFKGVRLFHGDGSLICVPLISGGKTLGVLNVTHPYPEFFETWHQHMLLLFANSLGHLLHLHRLIHDLEGVVAERTHALESALEESESLRARYQRLSTTDELTGLNNRRHFFSEGESLLAMAIRYRAPFSLMLIDIDYFKKVNDRWGHGVGDDVLRKVAGILKTQVRAADLLCRMGGEEFVLVIPNTDGRGIDRQAKRIQDEISGTNFGEGGSRIDITVSIGMTTLAEVSEKPLPDLLEYLFYQADCAMYRCKNQGRNQRLFYTPDLDEGGDGVSAAG
jgi:diguanylate cyclase (GGDEF)-like protein